VRTIRRLCRLVEYWKTDGVDPVTKCTEWEMEIVFVDSILEAALYDHLTLGPRNHRTSFGVRS